MSKLIDDLRKNNYNDESLYHRAADRIEELEKKLDQALEYIDTSARNFLLDEWGKS
mgnify:FL=1